MTNTWNRLRAGYRAFKSPIAKTNTRNQYESWWFKHGPKQNNSWLERFCEFHKIPPLQFISCFDKRESIHLSQNLKKVFFAPENLKDRFNTFEDFMIGEVDFSMGFEFRNHPKYLRFPLWLLYFTSPDIRNPGERFAAVFSREWDIDRPYFCSQIASHDERGNGKGLRTSCSSELAEIGSILNAGKLLNNTTLLQEKYHNNPSFFLRDCRFNICLENSSAPGYTTEKIFRPLQSGAIPIYWGDPIPEPQILRPDCYLRFDPSNPEILKHQVMALEENRSLRADFLRQPKLQQGAADWINTIHNDLAETLRRL